jgi:glycosyltransferase involved in cell wall biosynthesis
VTGPGARSFLVEDSELRILCVTNLFPNPLQPGKGLFNWRQLQVMSRLASVRVISPVLWTDEISCLFRGKRLAGNCEWREWDGVHVAYCRYYYPPKLGRSWYGKCFQWSIQGLFRKTIAHFRPDLVYACWAYPDGWAACHLAKEYGLPAVVKLHGSDLLLMDEFRGRREATTEMLRNADATIAVGETLRERAVASGAPADRAHFVHGGTDLELFSPGNRCEARRRLGLPIEGHRVLFVGNLVPVKGVQNLIDACESLKRDGVAVQTDLLGDGPLEAKLRRQIGAHGLQDRVHLRGRKTQKDLPHWYRAADLLVLPSLSEGVPNVLMEAAACGTPFIATRVGGIAEIAHLSPHPLIAAGDSESIAQSIQAALRDSAGHQTIPEQRSVCSTNDSVNEIIRIFKSTLAMQSAGQHHVEPEVALSERH